MLQGLGILRADSYVHTDEYILRQTHLDFFISYPGFEDFGLEVGGVDAMAVGEAEGPAVTVADYPQVANVGGAERGAHVGAVVVQGVVLAVGEEKGDSSAPNRKGFAVALAYVALFADCDETGH